MSNDININFYGISLSESVRELAKRAEREVVTVPGLGLTPSASALVGNATIWSTSNGYTDV